MIMTDQIKKRGGKPRTHKKESYTKKFYRINGVHFGNGKNPDHTRVKEVR